MGWSTTAPTLPSGSEWVQKDTIRISNNQLDVIGTLYFARLEDTGFALKLVEKRTFHLTNPNFTDFYKTYHRCDVAGVIGTAYTEKHFGNSGSTKTYYFTGTAAAGATIYVLVGVKVDNSTDSSTFTAPASLGIIAYVNVNGTWKKASPWVNIGGTWKQVVPYINNAGTWK